MMLSLLLALAPSVAPAQDCGSCDSKAKAAVTSNVDAPKDIVDTAVAAGSFKTLVAAVQAAELVDALKGKGPFTVFAPTDEAFAALPKGTLETLLDPKNKGLLTSILTYHVVSGQADPAAVVGEHATVQGSNLTVTGSGNDLKVNDAGVVCGGIKTANATLYLIDTVLMPPAAPAETTSMETSSMETTATPTP